MHAFMLSRTYHHHHPWNNTSFSYAYDVNHQLHKMMIKKNKPQLLYIYFHFNHCYEASLQLFTSFRWRQHTHTQKESEKRKTAKRIAKKIFITFLSCNKKNKERKVDRRRKSVIRDDRAYTQMHMNEKCSILWDHLLLISWFFRMFFSLTYDSHFILSYWCCHWVIYREK